MLEKELAKNQASPGLQPWKPYPNTTEWPCPRRTIGWSSCPVNTEPEKDLLLLLRQLQIQLPAQTAAENQSPEQSRSRVSDHPL
jgi:hypothetical protein